MTPEQIEFHRKRFEKWFCGDLDVNLKRDAFGNYTFMNAHAAWKAWISAIESIEIELPNYLSLNEDMEEKDIITRVVHNDCVGEFKFIIKAAGLKVKESWQ